jgi:hypothetical protein
MSVSRVGDGRDAQVSASRRRIMKRLSVVLCTVVAACSVVLSPGVAGAQGHAHGRHYSKADVARIIDRVEAQSGSFRKAVDRQLDHSRLNGTKREDQINAQVKRYDRSVDELRAEFSRHDSWMETRGNVEHVLRQASDVDHVMHDTGFGGGIEGEWSNLRRELNTLADVYNLKPLR